MKLFATIIVEVAKGEEDENEENDEEGEAEDEE